MSLTFLGVAVVAGIAVALAIAGLLYWEPWRMFHQPQHSAGRRLRVDLPALSATVPVAVVEGEPPWPCLPREWIEVSHDELADYHGRPVALLPVPAPDMGWPVPVPGDADTRPLPAAPAALPRGLRAVPADGHDGGRLVLAGSDPGVDARKLPNVDRWMRSAARRDGVAAWFARELAAA